MNQILIENDILSAIIDLHGAELKSIRRKCDNREYLWDGSFGWKRSAPVLFPNIGGLAGERYIYRSQEYPAPPHGFARDMNFSLLSSGTACAQLCLFSSPATQEYFPFQFSLEIIYRLEENCISTTWIVSNLDTKDMYFSIGAHPGFCLLPGTTLEDYTLHFDRTIDVVTRRVQGRYLTPYRETLAQEVSSLSLSPQLLAQDAIILEDTGIRTIALEGPDYKLVLDFPDFPVVALWTDPHTVEQARFLCLEPWCGINALSDEPKCDISQKARINMVRPGQRFMRTYRIGVNMT